MMKRLGKVTQRYVDQFDEAAQVWGWESDQGSGKSVQEAEAWYKEAKAQLIARLCLLEARAKG